jgi:hypothetical protein
MEPFSRACLSAMKRGDGALEASQILTGQPNGREGGAAEYRRWPGESIGCAGVVADAEAERLQPSPAVHSISSQQQHLLTCSLAVLDKTAGRHLR